MDEFTRIKTFIKVVEAGSFSAVAREQSSVSSVARQVKALEDAIGVRLLNRNSRSLSLTEPGRRFYTQACEITASLKNAMSEAASFQDSVKGVLRVSLRVSTASTRVLPALPRFLASYPELSVEITLNDEKCDLIANSFDVAVWMGHLPDSDIVARRLATCARRVCASPSYLAAHGMPETPEDLVKHNCLLFAGRDYGNTWIFSRNGVQKNVEVKGTIRSDNSMVLFSAALHDAGLIMTQEWVVQRALAQGQLIQVLKEYMVNPVPGEADLYVVYPSARGLSLKVRVFVDFLIELFRDPTIN